MKKKKVERQVDQGKRKLLKFVLVTVPLAVTAYAVSRYIGSESKNEPDTLDIEDFKGANRQDLIDLDNRGTPLRDYQIPGTKLTMSTTDAIFSKTLFPQFDIVSGTTNPQQRALQVYYTRESN